MTLDLTTYVNAKLPLIEKALQEILAPLKNNSDPLLFNATSYSVLNPGKRIRPLLTLIATSSLGGDDTKALYPACAIELLHTYSLIHDDLPCMDDDDLRRGKPTLHKMYPEGQAVLTGDLLLTLAFEILTLSPDITATQALELIKVLAKKSGGQGMILGQSLDLLGENKSLSWKELSQIHHRKTADLISTCLEFAAILSDKPSCRPVLEKIGEDIGLSFQIIDDVLDVEGEEHILGKPLRSDLDNQKSTSTSLLGLSKAKAKAEELLASSLQRCKDIGLENSLLKELLPKLVYRSF
ncbi:MAG: farnesyl diphosphate synthase [Chlamydiota bacterium]